MNRQQQKQAIAELRTLRDMLRFGASCFNAANIYFGHGTDNAWDEALQLVLHSLHLSHRCLERGEKILDTRLTSHEREQIIDLYNQRIVKRIPNAYLTHEAWFCGLPFYVDERVLIPRSPIAELIENQFETWIDPTQVKRILDVGTGSGCIAIACALYFPKATIDGVDISAEVLKAATINAHKHQVQEQVNLILSDLFTALLDKQYDIIIANPPYVNSMDMASLPREYLHEPRSALVAGEDGLDCVKVILTQANEHLTDNGILIVEVGNSASALMEQYPKVPFLWLEFERGGEGVFLLRKDQLNICSWPTIHRG